MQYKCLKYYLKEMLNAQTIVLFSYNTNNKLFVLYLKLNTSILN